MKRYGTYIKPYLGAFILGPLLMLTEVAGEIMLPKLMSMIINNGVAQRNVQYILSVGGLMILATLIMAIGGIGGAYFSVKAAVSFTSDLRDDLFSKVQEFSFKNIDSYSTGSLVTRLTKTMNVDIYNYWHYAITGTVVQLMTGSLIYGVLGAICHAALSLKMADWTAKRVQNIVGLEGISIPQGYGSSSVPLFVLLDAIYEKIPFMKGRNIDAQEIQKRYGMVGDPVIIGVVLGLIFGLAAGEGFKGCASLMITVAAIMVLFPRMIRLIVEGLMPISDGARKFFQKYFKGREVYIGLDTAVTLGHPTTIAVGLLLIPIMLILASILPGNKVLPLADLPVAPFFICMATVIHRGDLVRTLISGVIVMITVLLIATQFAPYFTEMALKGGFSFAGESAQISALSVGNMFGWSISELMSLGIIGVVVAVGIVASVVLFLRKRELSE